MLPYKSYLDDVQNVQVGQSAEKEWPIYTLIESCRDMMSDFFCIKIDTVLFIRKVEKNA